MLTIDPWKTKNGGQLTLVETKRISMNVRLKRGWKTTE
jgi:hypothetical protein